MEGSTNHDSAWLIVTTPSNIGHTTYIFWNRYWHAKKTIDSTNGQWANSHSHTAVLFEGFFHATKHTLSPTGQLANRPACHACPTPGNVWLSLGTKEVMLGKATNIMEIKPNNLSILAIEYPLYYHIVLYPFIIPSFCIVRFGQLGFHRTVPRSWEQGIIHMNCWKMQQSTIFHQFLDCTWCIIMMAVMLHSYINVIHIFIYMLR